MNKVCIIGSSSSISKGFLKKIQSKNKSIILVGRDMAHDDILLDIDELNYEDELKKIPLDCNYYLITLGLLLPQKITEQTRSDTLKSFVVNLIYPVKLIETILTVNENARIVLLGSESGEKGSYDTSYFLAKAALHQYVKERYINNANQQLVLIAPSVIIDTKMTQQRDDLDELVQRAEKPPKKRYLKTKEVVELIYYLFFIDSGYINNEVININGGKFARMHYT